jgi:hypothetical protein
MVHDTFLGVKLPAELKATLERLAAGEAQTVSEWIRQRIAQEARRRLEDSQHVFTC